MSPRPLKVGFQLPHAEDWAAGRTPGWRDLVAMAKLAEEVGFDSLWVADHLVVEDVAPGEAPHGIWEGWTLLSAIAASTSRVELGPLVACTGFRNPALLAKMADTLDEISGGRVVLGLGAGYQETEHRMFGYPLDHLVGRFEEALQIVHSLLRTGAADFSGRHYEARECELRPRGPRPEGPPILVGAFGERMLRLTARYADLWNALASHPDDVPPLRTAVDAACAAVGRDPGTLGRTIFVWIDLPGSDAGSDWVRRMRAYVKTATGSTDELAELLRGFALAGISHAVVCLQPGTLEGIESFAAVLERLDQGAASGIVSR